MLLVGITHGPSTPTAHVLRAAWMTEGQQLSLVVWSPRRVPLHTSAVSPHALRLWPQPSLQHVAPSSVNAPPPHSSKGGGGGGGGGSGGVQKPQPRHLHHAQCELTVFLHQVLHSSNVESLACPSLAGDRPDVQAFCAAGGEATGGDGGGAMPGGKGMITHDEVTVGEHGTLAARIAEGQHDDRVVSFAWLRMEQTSGASAHWARDCPQPEAQQAVPLATPEQYEAEAVVAVSERRATMERVERRATSE